MIRNSFFEARRIYCPSANLKTGGEYGAANSRKNELRCRVALIGFGTVGRAVAKILCENGSSSLRLTHICNRNVERKKAVHGFRAMLYGPTMSSRVLKSDVEIVIELIGGPNPAEQIVRSALGQGNRWSRRTSN